MKKALTVILSALVFGVVAGGTMVGVNVAAGRAVPAVSAQAQAESSAAEQQTETEKETEPETKADLNKTSESTAAEIAGTQNGAVLLDVSGIVDEAMPQVVSITNTMLIKQQGYTSIFDYYFGMPQTQEYEVPASGSGVIVQKNDDELLIVTNNHVVEDSKELSVTFVNGETVDANLKGTDADIDIAVIAVSLKDIPEETLSQIKVATLHDSEDLKVGEGVIAIGNALGYGQSVTVGYISALGREVKASENSVYSDLIQTDAAINPGNSGGALINMKGEVIGINVAKLADTTIEGIGYSIPIYKAINVIENLSNAKTKKELASEDQGRLGVYINTITADQAKAFNMPQGVMIRGFSDDEIEGYVQVYSPAKDAGIVNNDIITAFDGQNVKTAEELMSLVKYYEKDSKVDVTVQRLENGEYKEHVFTVTLGAAEDGKEESEKAEEAEGKSELNKIEENLPSHNGDASAKNDDESKKEENAKDGSKAFGNDRPEPKDGERPERPDGKERPDQKGQDKAEESEAETETETGAEAAEGEGYDVDIYNLFREFMKQYE